MDLTDKIVLVTGASSGIGRELARQLAARGAKLVLVARRQELLDSLVAELGAERAVAARADVGDRAQVDAAIAVGQQRFGRLDVLVNNAGVGYFGAVEAMPADKLEQLLRTNVFGPVFAVQAALPLLKASKGMIVNVSSGLSKRALPFLSAYSGTKAMLDSLSDGLRMELKGHGIRVLTYCPPEVATDFAANAMATELAGRQSEGERKKAPTPQFVRRLVRAIERERREVVEAGPLALMNFVAPWLLDRIFYRAMVLPMSRKR
jgi:NAD(P)-dependent dehydrogenase (short-subunit alcohol dehydrogenase family)